MTVHLNYKNILYFNLKLWFKTMNFIIENDECLLLKQ